LDGNIVRSLKSTTIGGSVLDASADFALVFAGFLFYTNNGIVSPTLLLAMGASFAYYLLTAKTVVQSVFGKHIGTVLFVLLGFTILSPSRIVGICVSLIGVLYITVSTIIRFNCIRKAHHIA
jgi:phosphatidylglycerophosphate synthase